jgi:hypothetical protein
MEESIIAVLVNERMGDLGIWGEPISTTAKIACLFSILLLKEWNTFPVFAISVEIRY